MTVQGWPGGFDLALDSLDLRRFGIELLSVRGGTGDLGEIATVFVPDDRVSHFFERLEGFANLETTRGQPKYRALVANIEDLRRAAIEELWTDEEPFPTTGDPVWWEVWLRRTGDELTVLRQLSIDLSWELAAAALEFPTRTVTALRATTSGLRRALSSRLPIAELRRPRIAQSPAELPLPIQRELGRQLAERIEGAPIDSPAVCLLDTGIYRHTVLAASLAHEDILHVVGTDGVDRHGHGTEQGGLALFGDLTDALTGPHTVRLRHRLESVKVLPDPPGANPPETYGAVTARGTSAPEANRPTRRRVFCLANSDHGYLSDGRPTSWSATVDALAFGTDVITSDEGLELLSAPDPDASRLVVVSAGNVRDRFQLDHLALSDTSAVEDPAQAWNALTVGASTMLDTVGGGVGLAGYRPVAAPGELSPFSRTSLGFRRIWPNKPDILLEGGNLLVSPRGTDFTSADAVSLATTSMAEPDGVPFTTSNATSAAAAQAARLAALAMADYPQLWPETVRGLLVQAAQWTAPMQTALSAAPNLTARHQIVRRYGFGVPTESRVLSSASSSVTLISQFWMTPFARVNGSRTRLRDMHIHELPWPREQLLDLGEVPVTLRVTLSYFIEPNPSSRGWRGRYVYPSHGMRFDIRRPGESLPAFKVRLNALAEVEEVGGVTAGGLDPDWFLGPLARNTGSLHSDVWSGTAADLADSGVVGVYPVGGWWKNNNRRDRLDLAVRYALLVSLSTPRVDIDLYTPIAVQVGIPVPIET